MPIYEYQCEKCEKVEEILMRFSDPEPEDCTFCGGPVRKLLSQTSFALKGSGWYVTDYKPGAAAAKAKEEGSGESAKIAEGADAAQSPAASVQAGAAGSNGSKSSSDSAGAPSGATTNKSNASVGSNEARPVQQSGNAPGKEAKPAVKEVKTAKAD